MTGYVNPERPVGQGSDDGGLSAEGEDADAPSRDDPGMAALYASSIRGRIAVDTNIGHRVARLGDQIDRDSIDLLQSPRCATVNGFSVHANVSIPAHDTCGFRRGFRCRSRSI
jgi:hypothetical protein